MKINWVFADGYQIDPTVNIDSIKSIGPTWGSWKTWRGCSTDNVICHDVTKAHELIQRAFQAVCNFYVPKDYYQSIGRPMGVKLYEGSFTQEVDCPENVVALHLVSNISDIVLLAGFDLSEKEKDSDRFQEHKNFNYRALIHSIIVANPDTQWVLVDHPNSVDKSFKKLSNLTCDIMPNVLKLLV